MMFRKILFYFIKYLIYILVIIILTAFLAKTGNMPGALPQKYINKINDYTDLALVKLNIIHNSRVLQKLQTKNKVNSEEVLNYDTRLNINIFTWLYNAVFINNYTLKIYNEINSTADSLQGFILTQYNKYDNLANSSYVTKFVEENEYGINNNNASLLNNNVLFPLKEIKQMIIYNNEKAIFNSSSDTSLKIDEDYLTKLFTKANENIQIIKADNNKNYFVFLVKKEKYSVYFIVSAEYFNVYLEELNVKNNFFIFNQNYDVLYSNISDEKLITDLPEKMKNNKLTYNNQNYNFQFIRLSKLNLYCGVVFPIYPVWKIIFNLLRDILILGIIYILYLSINLLYKKLSTLKIKSRPSQLELMTGAMLEVVKNIKSTANVVKPEPQVKLDNYTVERIIEKVVSTMENKISSNDELAIKGTPRAEKKNKDYSEWKLIEP